MSSYASYVLRLFTGEAPAAHTCKYHPSCSQYATDALHKYGPVRGSLRAAWRVLRCNPWSRGGVDYA
jgi:putative membrane protein insertion efficiency factor